MQKVISEGWTLLPYMLVLFFAQWKIIVLIFVSMCICALSFGLCVAKMVLLKSYFTLHVSRSFSSFFIFCRGYSHKHKHTMARLLILMEIYTTRASIVYMGFNILGFKLSNQMCSVLYDIQSYSLLNMERKLENCQHFTSFKLLAFVWLKSLIFLPTTQNWRWRKGKRNDCVVSLWHHRIVVTDMTHNFKRWWSKKW